MRPLPLIVSGLVLALFSTPTFLSAQTAETPAVVPPVVTAPAGPSVVRVVNDGKGQFSLTRNGQPYQINGVGGTSHLDMAHELGATTIRTWGAEELDKKVDGKNLLDRCEALDLTVMAGIWVQHERHGFNYKDPAQIKKQRETVREVVRKYKNYPALLIWGLGNEMEDQTGKGDNVHVWKELNELAKIIHEEDPNHPVCTVLAGANGDKVRSLMPNYPELDILGINAYSSAGGVGKALVSAGWKKPFLLTEFGPVGHWEVGTAAWGAPIESSSRDKAANYFTSHKSVISDGAGRCLGTFAFVWGQKQEVTSTWYGMFLSTGEKLPSVDAMAYAWTGHWPANRSPRIESLTAPFKLKNIAPATATTVTAVASDPEKDTLTYEWQIVAESTDRKTGGDHEDAPPTIPGCIVQADGPTLKMRTPSKPGPYRVFCIVRDGKGGASADNFPFLVK